MEDTLSLSRPYDVAIMKKEERAHLQRERSALLAIARGHKWFERMYDDDDVVRVVDGLPYELRGNIVVKVRGYKGSRPDWGLSCSSCPLGELTVADPPDGIACTCGGSK